MNADAVLRCRIAAPIRDRFVALAAASGEKPSERLRALVTQSTALQMSAAPDPAVRTEGQLRGRVTVRLRPGDDVRLRQRAEARGIKPSTYAAGLLHAHLRGRSPLMRDELVALKQLLSELSALHRDLRATSPHDSLRELPVKVEELRRQVAALVRANHESWESIDA